MLNVLKLVVTFPTIIFYNILSDNHRYSLFNKLYMFIVLNCETRYGFILTPLQMLQCMQMFIQYNYYSNRHFIIYLFPTVSSKGESQMRKIRVIEI